MSDEHKQYATSAAATLEAHILSVHSAKNEAEWWANREILSLRAENEKLRADVALWAHKQMAHDSRLIERLRADNAKLRDALVGIACNCEADGEDCYYGHVLVHCPHRQARAAAAALKETGE